VGQDVVGLGDLLELGLGCLVSRVEVGVVLLGKLAKSLANVLVARGLGHAEDGIGVVHGPQFDVDSDRCKHLRMLQTAQVRVVGGMRAGLIISFVTIVLGLLVAEIVSRLNDRTASVWRFPNYIQVYTAPSPEERPQLGYDSVLGYQTMPNV